MRGKPSTVLLCTTVKTQRSKGQLSKRTKRSVSSVSVALPFEKITEKTLDIRQGQTFDVRFTDGTYHAGFYINFETLRRDFALVCGMLPSDVHERSYFGYRTSNFRRFIKGHCRPLFEKITEIPLWPFAAIEKLPFSKTTQYIASYFFISKKPAP